VSVLAILISPEGFFMLIVSVAIAESFCNRHAGWSWEELPPRQNGELQAV
jgi:hypothetical protein